jgi:NADH:ubiquinone oxidoreductase subunit 3 (subunit A)
MQLIFIYTFNSKPLFLYYGDPFLVSRSFFSISLFLFIAGSICSLMVILPYLFSSRTKINIEKLSEYECEFEPFDSATRQPFSIHSYVVGIIFLIFDVELASLFSFSSFLIFLNCFSFFIIIFFLIFFIIDFIYE